MVINAKCSAKTLRNTESNVPMSETNASSDSTEKTVELKVGLQAGQHGIDGLSRSRLETQKVHLSNASDSGKGKDDFHSFTGNGGIEAHQPAPETNANPIKFDGLDDPGNPANWPRRYKCFMTFVLAGMTFVTTFTSAIFSTAINATAQKFSVSTEVTTLGTSIFLLGFCFGPILWGPLSELYGRRVPLFIGILGMSCFEIGVAVALNLETIMICRFFAGVFGSAPLAVVGGALSDFWNPVERGVTVGVYSMCTFVGPVAAPIIGGYVAESYLGWRWTEYIAVIMGEEHTGFTVELLLIELQASFSGQ